MKRAVMLVLALGGCLSGCLSGGNDALDQRLAILTEPRVLAVIAEPAEAKPGAQVSYHAIVAAPDGPVAAMPRWSYCIAPKPPTEDNSVSTGCFDDTQLVALGETDTVTGTLPSDGCIRFGPDTPPGGFRPRDPDPTGGYYQPVRADVDELVAFGMSRITCKLPTAPADLARRYDLEYVANANPILDPIEVTEAAAGSAVTLTATWPAESAESYLWFDPLTQRLLERNESLRVSWFATAGTIDVDASAVDEDDRATSVSTVWHAPAAGTATLWFVLRDSRGGNAVQTATVDVR